MRLLYCFFLSMMICLPGAAEAAKKAFIVGISRYDDVDLRLDTPIIDADRLRQQLAKLNFDVIFISETKATKAGIESKWKEFVSKTTSSDEIVFYFSGHGISVEGVNYLVPKEVRRKDMPDPQAGSISKAQQESALRRLVSFTFIHSAAAEKAPVTAIWILDACRDNGFEFSRPLDTSRKALGNGNFILFSAAEGERSLTFLDDSERGKTPPVSSVYTRVFLDAIKDYPSRDISQVANGVQEAVASLTSRTQNPAFYDSISSYWCFGKCDPKFLVQIRYVSAELVTMSQTSKEFTKSMTATIAQGLKAAIFLGKRSRAAKCESATVADVPFGCDVLKTMVSGQSSSLLGSTLQAVTDVNVRSRVPITTTSGTQYGCRIGVVHRLDQVRIVAIYELQYLDDTFFWGTLDYGTAKCS